MIIEIKIKIKNKLIRSCFSVHRLLVVLSYCVRLIQAVHVGKWTPTLRTTVNLLVIIMLTYIHYNKFCHWSSSQYFYFVIFVIYDYISFSLCLGNFIFIGEGSRRMQKYSNLIHSITLVRADSVYFSKNTVKTLQHKNTSNSHKCNRSNKNRIETLS